jgi:putative tryptophan/tyrosine transport system substrate-binding protein
MRSRLAVAGLVVLVVTAPLPADAQQAGKVARVGWLTLGSPTDPVVRTQHEIFLRGMRDFGWVEGRNMMIEARYTSGRQDLLPEAGELVRAGVDVIVALSPLAVAAARKATSTVPIVGVSMGDPVRVGWATSLARPGGNVTGLANLRTALTGKWLELLKEMIPQIARVAVLANPTNLDRDDYMREVAVATRSWRAEVRFFNAEQHRDLETVFAEVSKWRPGGLLVIPDATMFWAYRDRDRELCGKEPATGGLLEHRVRRGWRPCELRAELG